MSMIEVRFRFYGRLNDFLPLRFRQRRFTHVMPTPASVKDVIEALGVPHPEADVILVKGKGEDFAYRLADGDDVSVYPVFRSIDVAGLPRAGSDPPQPVRFVLDTHLGKLSSLLRLCGFDAIRLEDDADVANVSAHDGRIALTRDVGLLKRGIVRYGYWIRHTDPELQLAEVLEQFDLADRMEPFSRCLRCNTPIAAVDAGTVSDRLLPRTRVNFQDFRHCPGCGRIYWQGSHYGRLAALVQRARQRLSD
jgi:uncharacterized protein with PIN domain